jgi:hypothetical protein
MSRLSVVVHARARDLPSRKRLTAFRHRFYFGVRILSEAMVLWSFFRALDESVVVPHWSILYESKGLSERFFRHFSILAKWCVSCCIISL